MEEQIMMNDCKDYEMNKGIRLMSATSQSKQAEDDDFSLESLGILECRFTESYYMLMEKADEMERTRLCRDFQIAANMAMLIFKEDLEYVLERDCGVADALDSREIGYSFWLEDNNSMYGCIDKASIDVILDELGANSGTRNRIDFLMELARNRTKGSCSEYVKTIKKVMS